MSGRSQSPRQLSHILGDLQRRMDKKGMLLATTVARVWPDAVGKAIAAHTGRPTLEKGQLRVPVDNSAWAHELQSMAEPIRLEINTRIGKEAVREIRFYISKEEVAPRQNASSEGGGARAAVARREPLSEEERNIVERSVASIPDEDLREAVLRATIADLEAKKAAGHDS